MTDPAESVKIPHTGDTDSLGVCGIVAPIPFIFKKVSVILAILRFLSTAEGLIIFVL